MEKRSVLAAAATVALGLAIGVAAEDYAQAAPNAPNAASDIFKKTTAATFLPPGGVVVVVQTMTLRAGDWVVTSEDNAVGLNQPTDVVRCGLRTAGDAFHVTHATQIGNADGYPFVAMLSATVGLHLTGNTVVENFCLHDAANGATYYIDPEATMWAHKASDLNP